MRWFNHFYVKVLCWPYLACTTVKIIYILRGERAVRRKCFRFNRKHSAIRSPNGVALVTLSFMNDV